MSPLSVEGTPSRWVGSILLANRVDIKSPTAGRYHGIYSRGSHQLSTSSFVKPLVFIVDVIFVVFYHKDSG
jgi:hypothetical protein